MHWIQWPLPTIFSVVKVSALNPQNSVTSAHCFQCYKSQCFEIQSWGTEFSAIGALFSGLQLSVPLNSVKLYLIQSKQCRKHWNQCPKSTVSRTRGHGQNKSISRWLCRFSSKGSSINDVTMFQDTFWSLPPSKTSLPSPLPPYSDRNLSGGLPPGIEWLSG